jgi:phage tail sheath protein FI
MEDVSSAKYTWQPPTMMAVEAMALTDNIASPWFAPAGMNRGRANSTIVRGDIKPNKAKRDTLYQGRINPIATFIQEGVVIFGQKTLQVNQSALDRINVRRLLLQVRRLISAASLTLVFEQNDQTLRDQFLSRVEPLLLNIQNQRGLTGFKVIMDDSNNTPETIDRNTLVGKIQLKPTPTAEFIDLTFQVLPTGANFEDF